MENYGKELLEAKVIMNKRVVSIQLLFIVGAFYYFLAGGTSCSEIFSAIEASSISALTEALEGGGDANCAGYDGYRPLSRAILTNNVELVTGLIQHGADVNLTDGGVTPIYYAIIANCIPCAQIISAAGGTVAADRGDIDYAHKIEHVRNNPYFMDLLDCHNNRQTCLP